MSAMTRKPKLQWWIIPGVIATTLTAFGGLGTCAVTYAKHKELPDRVVKIEAKDEQQDEEIIDLKSVASKIAGYTEALTKMQQQAPNLPAPTPSSPLAHWTDQQGQRWCCAKTSDCNQRIAWWRCDE